ncbi:MAG: class I SAM-dependent methyltransferase [Gammaproteobacteria bacterium]
MVGVHYVIRGGVEGRERLRILARVMRPTTLALFDRLGVSREAACLDVGCGGGDVAVDLARHVSPSGKVVGTDIDDTKLELALADARSKHLTNIQFRKADAASPLGAAEYDLAYARFLLTHLNDPAACINRMCQALKPGGLLVVEDIHFSGHFSYPESAALQRYIQLYAETVRARGGDPDIGPKLPLLLADAGFERIGMNIVQPAGLEGEVKLLNPITMENIAEAVLQEGLATLEEIDKLVKALYTLAHDARTVVSIPRIVQAWGYRSDVGGT